MTRRRSDAGKRPPRGPAPSSRKKKRRAYEPPRLVRVDLEGMGSLDLNDGNPILAQGAPSSPNISGATVFPGGGPPPTR